MKIYNFKRYEQAKEFLQALDETPNVYSLEEGYEYLNIDRMDNYPKDYYEPVWCPITVFHYKYKKYFEYLDPKDSKGIQKKLHFLIVMVKADIKECWLKIK